MSRRILMLAGVAVVAGWTAVQAQRLTSDRAIMNFRVPEYDDQGHMLHQIFGRAARIQASGDAMIAGLRLEVYKDGRLDVLAESPLCVLERATKVVWSEEAVTIRRENMRVTGMGFRWDNASGRFMILKRVKIVLRDASQQAQKGMAE